MAILHEVAARNLRELREAREGLGDGWIVRRYGLALSFADGAPRACRADEASRFTREMAQTLATGGEVVHVREAIESAINRLENFLAQQG